MGRGGEGGAGEPLSTNVSVTSLPINQLRRLLAPIRNVHLEIVIVLEVVIVIVVVGGRVQLRFPVLVVHGVPASHHSSFASSSQLEDQGDENDEQGDTAEGSADDESSAVVRRQQVLLVGFWVVHVQHAWLPAVRHLQGIGGVRDTELPLLLSANQL